MLLKCLSLYSRTSFSLQPCPNRRNINYFVNKPSWSKAPESEKHPGMIQLLHVSRGHEGMGAGSGAG